MHKSTPPLTPQVDLLFIWLGDVRGGLGFMEARRLWEPKESSNMTKIWAQSLTIVILVINQFNTSSTKSSVPDTEFDFQWALVQVRSIYLVTSYCVHYYRIIVLGTTTEYSWGTRTIDTQAYN